VQNSPLVPLLNESGGAGRTIWLGALMDLHLDILSAYDAKRAQATALPTLKATQMNRLQRSMCRDRLPSVAKDSTVGVSMFLVDILDTLQVHLGGNISDSEDFMVRRGFNLLIWYLLTHLRPRRR
jgi:midasin